MTEKQAIAFWWSDNHPLHNVELAAKHYPNIHYSDIKDIHIAYMFKKEVSEKKAYIASDIKYDTDGEKIDLPKKMVIIIPDNITGYEDIQEYISDEITNRTGWCHLGFNTIPEIPQD